MTKKIKMLCLANLPSQRCSGQREIWLARFGPDAGTLVAIIVLSVSLVL